jgi:GNAT superfamily N-acetyltransferase
MTATATIRLRPLRPGETETVDAVFEGMSPRSRHLRFHGPRPRLTEAMSRALSDVDGRRHVALVAEVADGERGEPVGLGHLIALGDDVAEVAFAVVDPWHGRGIGRRLLTALRYRAIDLRYDAVLAHVMVENQVAMRLLRTVFGDAGVRRTGTSYEVTAALPRRSTQVAITLAV